ncbi:thermonuclease family protein [Xanthobacter agilis]|uniref:thermonuclease family protein n=1 Tax=Xanthobacter agilis TaxID=47492 RepID=UPI003729A1C3
MCLELRAGAARVAAGVLAAWTVAGPLPAVGAARTTTPKPVACVPAAASADPSTRIVALTEDGSLKLEDGRRFVPNRIVLPTRLEPAPDVANAAARAVIDAIAGRPITLSRTAPDRHGRLTGDARLSNTSDAEGDLAALLVFAGAAYTAADAPCAPPLLALEAQARRARRGLWARPGAIATAGDPQAMGLHRGLYTVAEGQILTVGVRRERTYLNFGETWRQDFTVIVPTADFAIILEHGHDQGQGNGQGNGQDDGSAYGGSGSGRDPDVLRNARVRVRGVVREQGGPAIMVRSQADIERLADRTGSEDRR